MRRIKLLIIAIIIVIISISVTIIKLENKTATLAEDLKSLRAELGKNRIISHFDYFFRPIDVEELQTIQNELLWKLKLKYVKTPAKKRLIKRRWR